MARLTVAAFFASLWAAMALAAPAPGLSRIEASIEIATPSDPRPQLLPAVAYDGIGTFLVVWQQGALYHEQQQGDIFAVRIDRAGKLLDTRPIVISNAAESQEAPLVAFSNGVFLVVWQDYRSGQQWDVYGARVTAEGRVLDPDGLAISAKPESEALPQVAAAADGFIVVWQALATGYYELRGAHVSHQAAVTPFALQHDGKPLWGGDLALVSVASGWLLSWNDERSWSFENVITRRFARLSGNPRRPVVSTVHRAPAIHIGGDGGRFVVAGNRALYVGAQVAGRGQRVWTSALLDGSDAGFLPNPNPEKPWAISMWNPATMIPVVAGSAPVDGVVAGSFACGRYLLVARAMPTDRRDRNYRLIAVHLDADGRRLDEAQRVPVLNESSTLIANPVLAAGGQRQLLVYEQHDASGIARLQAELLNDCE